MWKCVQLQNKMCSPQPESLVVFFSCCHYCFFGSCIVLFVMCFEVIVWSIAKSFLIAVQNRICLVWGIEQLDTSSEGTSPRLSKPQWCDLIKAYDAYYTSYPVRHPSTWTPCFSWHLTPMFRCTKWLYIPPIRWAAGCILNTIWTLRTKC